jgi:predicted TIM-barrel fold metal-dependent hydrolase
VENGANWVPRLFEALSETHKKMPQLYGENPIEAIQRCIYLNPFWEENLADLCEFIPVDHLIFGSDYPHPEGLAEPLSYADHHHGLPKPDKQISMVMGDNLDRLMRA